MIIVTIASKSKIRKNVLVLEKHFENPDWQAIAEYVKSALIVIDGPASVEIGY